MKKATEHSIPSVAVVFFTISSAILYYFVFICSKIIIHDLNLINNKLINIIIAIIPSILFTYIVYFWSRTWQRKKMGEIIRLKAVPLIEQIPYMISFVILYVIAVFTVDFINTATNVQYFPSSNTGLFLALGFGTAMTVRSWDIFVQHYWSEPQLSSGDSGNSGDSGPVKKPFDP